ncbi:hypothetical protein DY123_06140 [Apilactobacillus micheneri]|uniref:hypothetical protein n=1 Tax=Apilactobacillus micheneri TaxID=1899430 RepID=UPI0011273043|nr:hypothetical protein [Apilactobacillus micheneri]TPR41453.1 hypothetical protein DY123_06140 [Apilactobacillus micheneri]
MQSSLKKSLYLGLAALSFASVASVTANASNANAAKKHAAAKKVTYKTTNKNLDQSVTFKATGKNAVYNKAVGKRSVVASKADMASKANSKDTKDLFMAYQEGVTSKGVHYYKVVSFDKKVRGFVYNKGVAKTNTTVAADKPLNTTGYLQNTNRFFNKPYGSQFKTSLKNDYKAMNLASDQFTVSDAVKVNNDQTYYYVTDKNNQLVNGWVNSVYFSNNVTPAAQKAMDAKSAVNASFVSSSNLGSTLFTTSVNPKVQSNGKYSNADVLQLLNNQLKGHGYQPADYNQVHESVNGAPVTFDKDGYTAQGTNITVEVTPDNSNNKTTVPYTVQGLATNGYQQTATPVANNLLKAVNLDNSLYNSLFTGTPNSAFNYANFKSQLLDSGKALNVLSNIDGKTTYKFNAKATETNAANSALFDKDGKAISNATFNDVKAENNGAGLNLVYDVVTANGTTTTTVNSNDTNIFGGNSGQATVDAINDAKSLVTKAAGYMKDNQISTLRDAEGSDKANTDSDALNAAVKTLSDNSVNTSKISNYNNLTGALNAEKAQKAAIDKVNDVANSLTQFTGDTANGKTAYVATGNKDQLQDALNYALSQNNMQKSDLQKAVNDSGLVLSKSDDALKALGVALS